MSDIHVKNRAIVSRLNAALYDIEEGGPADLFDEIFAEDCIFRFCHPLGDCAGPREFLAGVYRPLLRALPDLERRAYICIAGPAEGGDWVGCAGNFVGVFESPWLDLPPTFQPVFMRFHEYYRVEEGRIVEVQAIWDIPQLMMQAGGWPMAPSLGVEWMVPGPASRDGLRRGDRDDGDSAASMKLVIDMLDGLQKHAEGGPAAMELDRFWHPKMNWYGPAGIGSCRRISGFRNSHQIPFLKAMPDRGEKEGLKPHYFADGPYVGVTGWPNMQMTLTGDGWLGIAPSGRRITMRSLDFWRCKDGLIRENWVLIDILNVYDQLGVDVFERMRECTAARQARGPML